MPDLSDIVKESIPGYPVCPVDSLCKRVEFMETGDVTEEVVKGLINEVKAHEGELRRFRQLLEMRLMEYSIGKIVDGEG